MFENMIKKNEKISWIINNKSTVLDEQSGYYLLSYDGFGIPAFHRLEEQGPLQHGVTDKGYRLDARTIILVIGIRGKNQQDFYQKKQQLINVFKPSNTIGSLRWEIDGTVRQIDGYLISGLEFAGGDRDFLFQKTAIAIKCPNPVWYEPEEKYIDFSISSGSDVLAVPMVIPMKMGGSAIGGTTPITYRGTVEEYPRIEIRGLISNFVITNTVTGEKLDFTGATVPANKSWLIDLRYGHKTITDSDGVNQISKLSFDSDLATFSLLPEPTAPNGINSIQVMGINATESTGITVYYKENYIGI